MVSGEAVAVAVAVVGGVSGGEWVVAGSESGGSFFFCFFCLAIYSSFFFFWSELAIASNFLFLICNTNGVIKVSNVIYIMDCFGV